MSESFVKVKVISGNTLLPVMLMWGQWPLAYEYKSTITQQLSILYLGPVNIHCGLGPVQKAIGHILFFYKNNHRSLTLFNLSTDRIGSFTLKIGHRLFSNLKFEIHRSQTPINIDRSFTYTCWQECVWTKWADPCSNVPIVFILCFWNLILNKSEMSTTMLLDIDVSGMHNLYTVCKAVL